MPNRIVFQFDDKLQYQLDAVRSVIRLFEGLPQKTSGIYERVSQFKKLFEGDPVRNIEITTGSRLLENLRTVQFDNNLYADSNVLPGNNSTVEMETGTRDKFCAIQGTRQCLTWRKKFIRISKRKRIIPLDK